MDSALTVSALQPCDAQGVLCHDRLYAAWVQLAPAGVVLSITCRFSQFEVTLYVFAVGALLCK